MKPETLLQHTKGGKSYTLPFVLITSLFLMWGLANNMTDTLLAAFKRIMSMSDFQTSLIQIAFYGAYFCFALPAALFIQRYSFKSGILLGLLLYAGGCFLFYPASVTASYGFYLFALYILAGGCSILETSANPYILAMGSEETATRRLNLAQAFNPIGSITGILLSQYFILAELNAANAAERAAMSNDTLVQIQAKELTAVTTTYVFVGVALFVIFGLILFMRMPQGNDSEKSVHFGATCKRLWANKRYRWGVVTQFFYVGAQIGVWSYTIRYVMLHLKLNEKNSATYYLLSIVLFAVSRFIFTALMKYFKPANLLTLSAICGIFASAVVIFGSGMAGVIALIAISGFMSLMFPTIYGIAMHKLGSDSKIGASGLIMAILGGAVLTAAQGLISDVTGSINWAYSVPLVCFMVIAAYGYRTSKIAVK